MSLVFDIIIILAAVAAIYRGISKGFIKSVMHFASIIIALVCVYYFTQPVATWIGEQFVNDSVTSITENALGGIINAGSERLDIETVLADRPAALTEIAQRFSCDLDELTQYYNSALSNESTDTAITNLSAKIAAPAADAISSVLAAILVFVAAMIACAIVTWALDLIFKLPVLKQLNKVLGTVFGILSAALTVWVLANISVGLIGALESVRADLFNESVIDHSIILNFITENDFLLIK